MFKKIAEVVVLSVISVITMYGTEKAIKHIEKKLVEKEQENVETTVAEEEPIEAAAV